uniref:Uncharacterized protein n=1 Tax=Arundo donax TaxID=35708 RepID=A0A0A8ZTC5_ARUDO
MFHLYGSLSPFTQLKASRFTHLWTTVERFISFSVSYLL